MAARRTRETELSRIADAVRVCVRCPLHRHRTRAVPGEGPVGATLFLIGEAPGRAEDAAGRPFVGPAGKVLDAALRGVRVPRMSVFITNVVKCRPPDNRRPRDAEIEACGSYLHGQIAAVQPKVIVTLGATALQAVVGPEAGLRDARGEVLHFGGVPVVPTYHPAAILYRRPLESAFRRDLRKAIRVAGRGGGLRSGPPREGRPTQVVRSSGAAVVKAGRVLLLHRRDEGIWCLPKGTLEEGESPKQAAVREVLEETGLDVRLQRPLADVRYAYYWPPQRMNVDKRVSYFLATPIRGRLMPESGFDDARWVGRGQALTLLSWPNDKAVVAKAFEPVRSIRATAGTNGPSRGAKRSARPRS